MPGSKNVLHLGGTIDRRAYFFIGAGLLVFKFALDWAVSRFLFHRPWLPWDYIAPGSSLALMIGVSQQRAFYLTMLLISLPFIGIGVGLTAKRLRSVGLSAGWTVLFFVPGINFVLFALLISMPRRDEVSPAALTQDTTEPPAPHSGNAPPLNYAPDTQVEKTWLDRILPASPSGAKAIAVFLPPPIALIATFASIHWFQNYGWGVFVGVPFAIGLMSAVLFSARSPRGVAGCVAVGCLSLTVYGVTLLVCAFEGAGCLIMTAPLAYPLTMIGAAVGASIGGVRPTRLQDAGRVIWVMLLFLPLFTGAERLAAPDAPLYAITTEVEIDAPPDLVWANVIGFREIPTPTDWIFKMGVAYPIRAEISGSGTGAMRYCVFSTGPFVEPITVWDEPRLLKFSVSSNPPAMKEWSPWNDIRPPHLENFLVSSGGQFLLTELRGGRTRLEGTTWYQHHMWPAAYWRLWSDFIIHRIHLRVLNHVKRLSEQG